METNKDIYELLIRMDEGQKFLIQRLDAIDGRLKEADRSRGKLHEKIYQVTEDVFVVGQTVGQQRDVIMALSNKVDSNHAKVEPLIERMRLFDLVRKWLTGLMVAVGITSGVMWVVARDWLISILNWLTSSLE